MTRGPGIVVPFVEETLDQWWDRECAPCYRPAATPIPEESTPPELCLPAMRRLLVLLVLAREEVAPVILGVEEPGALGDPDTVHAIARLLRGDAVKDVAAGCGSRELSRRVRWAAAFPRSIVGRDPTAEARELVADLVGDRARLVAGMERAAQVAEQRWARLAQRRGA